MPRTPALRRLELEDFELFEATLGCTEKERKKKKKKKRNQAAIFIRQVH